MSRINISRGLFLAAGLLAMIGSAYAFRRVWSASHAQAVGPAAAGTPVVASRSGGVVETVKDRDTGFSKKKFAMYFSGIDKPLILNRTNAEKLAQSFGKDRGNWVGKMIELYSEIGVWFGNDYSTGRKMIEDIFKMERKSTPRDLRSLLEKMS